MTFSLPGTIFESALKLKKIILVTFGIVLLNISGVLGQKEAKAKSLFDGRTFTGWEGDTTSVWRIENKAIVGGSLDQTLPNNNFLCTKSSYANFVLKLKIMLTGKEGFINSGIQFRSERMKEPAYEMTGYQADWGEGYWASLYDESRRNKTLMAPDAIQILQWIKKDDWNEYEIRAENNRIRLFINNHLTVDYYEEDGSIPQRGIIGLQIHGGGKAQVAIKDIFIEAL